jgi:hypothetical protein
MGVLFTPLAETRAAFQADKKNPLGKPAGGVSPA